MLKKLINKLTKGQNKKEQPQKSILSEITLITDGKKERLI